MNNRTLFVTALSLGGIVLSACTAKAPAVPTLDDTSSSASSAAMMPNSSDMQSSDATSSTPAMAPQAQTVTISGFAFAPQSLSVKVGTTVTWTNSDSVSHTITGDNGGPNSDALTGGQTYSYTFVAAGAFPYHCKVHPSMTGTVTVTQ